MGLDTRQGESRISASFEAYRWTVVARCWVEGGKGEVVGGVKLSNFQSFSEEWGCIKFWNLQSLKLSNSQTLKTFKLLNLKTFKVWRRALHKFSSFKILFLFAVFLYSKARHRLHEIFTKSKPCFKRLSTPFLPAPAFSCLPFELAAHSSGDP